MFQLFSKGGENYEKISIVAIFLIILVGCFPNSPSLGCSGEEILLDKSFFPEGSTQSVIISPLPDGTNYSASISIYLGKGLVNQDIFRFSSTRRAISEYNQKLKKPEFSAEADNEWFEPEALNLLNLQADKYQFHCGEQNNIPMCKVILQHDNYFVFANAHIYENEFSPLDMANMIDEIDARIQSCVG